MAKSKAKSRSKSRRKPSAKPAAAAPVAEAAAPVREGPRYWSDGILLNPEACHVSAEGVVTSK